MSTTLQQFVWKNILSAKRSIQRLSRLFIHRIFPVIYITIKLHYCLEFKTLKLGDLLVLQWLFSVVTTYGIFGLLSLVFGVR